MGLGSNEAPGSQWLSGKLGRNHTSVLACCRTNQIAQRSKLGLNVITDSQLAKFQAPKLKLLVLVVTDNVINKYNY